MHTCTDWLMIPCGHASLNHLIGLTTLDCHETLIALPRHLCDLDMQVWDDTGSNLLYVWKLPATDNPAAKCADFVRGISFNVSADGDVQLCAGCSSGAIQVFSIAAGPSIKPSATLQHHKTPIVALGSAYQSRRGAWSEDLTCELVSCDDQGTLAVWTADNASCYSCSHTIPGTGVPGCSVAVRKGFILCGKTDGTVQVYGLVSAGQQLSWTHVACTGMNPLQAI